MCHPRPLQRKTIPDSIDIINRTYQIWSYLKYNSVIFLMRKLEHENKAGEYPNLDVDMLGAAANLQKSDRRLSHLQGLERNESNKNRSIGTEIAARDIVGTWVGRNRSTIDTNTQNRGWIRTIVDIFVGKSSSHNCTGVGTKQCVDDGYRTKGKGEKGNDINTIHRISVYDLLEQQNHRTNPNHPQSGDPK